MSLFVGLGLGLVMIAFFLYRFQIVGWAQDYTPRCSVGIQGTAASITVIGFDADTMCQHLVHACDTNPNCTQMTFYQLPGNPTIAPIVCEGDYQYEHIIVRDIGSTGNVLCQGFSFPQERYSNAPFNFLIHNGATDAANQYYTAVEKQDYNTAFTYLGTSNLTLNGQSLTQSLYIQGAMLIDQTKGKLTAYSISNPSLNSNNGGSTAILTVSETRNGASYDVHVQLKQESSGWKITSVDNF